MKIAVLPYDPTFPNKYIERMVEAFKIAYPDAEITPFPTSAKNIFSLKGYDYVWLNWFENIDRRFVLKSFISKIYILVVLLLLRVKIISTFHNRQPHESTIPFLDNFIFWLTFKLSYKIIILSEDSKMVLEDRFGNRILKKVVLVPHPTYECVPKELKNNQDPFSILFFGHLRPYKNIELIFELAKEHPDIPFTIAGSPLNVEYEQQLKELSGKIPNVTLISRFISSQEIDDLINNNTILLLPYDIKSSLNSGVVIHAICKKINMIVPSIGTVNQLRNKDQIFSYSYKDLDEHKHVLSKLIEVARKEYETDKEKFYNRINMLYNEVISNQNPGVISIKLKKYLIKN